MDAEYRKHASKYSVKWLAAMTSKRKVVWPAAVDRVAVTKADSNDAQASEAAAAAIAKDRHLLDAAFAGDRMIITLDAKLQRWLEGASSTTHDLNNIRWLNPETDAVADLS